MALTSWWTVVVTVAAVLAWRATPPRLRVYVLLAASVAFYAPAGPRDLLVMSALMLFTWLIARALSRHPRRSLLALGVTGILAVLVGFKYLPMLVGTLNTLIRAVGGDVAIASPGVTLPAGISFVSFALIHALVEAYRGETVLDAPGFSLYTMFFPTVTMGPIKRYPEFTRDLAAVSRVSVGRFDSAGIAEGLWRITVGLFRKFVIADTVSVLVPYMTEPGGSRAMVLVGIAAYSLKIYFDFAGYSDMAIGVARLFGFRIMENFERPYLQRNVSDFWKHWHISLTRFITEYVFIPLGGSRASWWRVALNTMIAMGLSGLWHGAGWHFVAWGLYHGAGLVILRWWRIAVSAVRRRVPKFDAFASRRVTGWIARLAAWALTVCFVWAGWVLFALPLGEALAVYAKLLGLPAGTGARFISMIGGGV